MSLIQSARLNGHDPYAYLKDVLTRLPAQRASEIAQLLPHSWQPPTLKIAAVYGVAQSESESITVTPILKRRRPPKGGRQLFASVEGEHYTIIERLNRRIAADHGLQLCQMENGSFPRQIALRQTCQLFDIVCSQADIASY